MEPFKPVKGKAMPLNRKDVDTDQILPAQYLKRIERSGFGPFCFEAWRKDPNFVMNDERYAGSAVLLAGPNFGCGSSREAAPWALEDAGFRVVIAPSFGDIFRNNCGKIGLLTVPLGQADVDHLMARAEESPGFEVVVDLESQTVSYRDGAWSRHFEIDPFLKHCLLNGLDDIGLTMRQSDAISAFESGREDFRPVAAAI